MQWNQRHLHLLHQVERYVHLFCSSLSSCREKKKQLEIFEKSQSEKIHHPNCSSLQQPSAASSSVARAQSLVSTYPYAHTYYLSFCCLLFLLFFSFISSMINQTEFAPLSMWLFFGKCSCELLSVRWMTYRLMHWQIAWSEEKESTGNFLRKEINRFFFPR